LTRFLRFDEGTELGFSGGELELVFIDIGTVERLYHCVPFVRHNLDEARRHRGAYQRSFNQNHVINFRYFVERVAQLLHFLCVLVDFHTNFSENSEIVVPNVNEVVLRNGHACTTGVGENLLLVLQKGLFVLIG